MKNKFFKQRSFYAVFLSVALSVVLVAGAAGAATTISTNIDTGGTLTVSGQSHINGNINVGDSITTGDDRAYLYATTTVVGPQAFVFGSSSASTLSGQVAGSVYYDSDGRVLRLYDGSNWFPVASSTDAGGSLIAGDNTNLVRFNTVGSGMMALGTTTEANLTSGGTVLTIQATTSASVPLKILSAKDGGQSANLLEILGEAQDELFVIDGIGHASTTGSFQVGLVGGASISLFSVGGTATTTASNGNFDTEGALTFGGNATFGNEGTDLLTITAMATTSASISIGANSTVASFLYIGGMATTTATNGNIETQGSLTVGGDVSGTAIDRIFTGSCTTQDLSGAGAITINASTSAYIYCTTTVSITAGDKVMVTATTSLPSPIIIQAASSTASGMSIRVYNTGFDAEENANGGTSTVVLYNAADALSETLSFDFWAFR